MHCKTCGSLAVVRIIESLTDEGYCDRCWRAFEATAPAYPVKRCKTCRWWVLGWAEPNGNCQCEHLLYAYDYETVGHDGLGTNTEGQDASVVTDADFGCIHWEQA